MDKGSHVNRENDPILHAATGWVLELQNPDVGPERIAAWERWLAEDPRHVQAFDKVAAMWSSAAELRRVPLPSEGELADDDYDGTLSVSAWRMRAAPVARPRVDTASVREATRTREQAVSGDKASLHGGWSITAIAAGLCALAVLWGVGGNVFIVP